MPDDVSNESLDDVSNESPDGLSTNAPSAGEPGNVVLTGFMGTGKSTVGRVVADLLGFEFVDTDEVIERRHGAIREIFASQGEKAFRRMERDVAAELAQRTSLVVATGGRLMLDEANKHTLGQSGFVLCLTAPASEILQRVLGDPSTTERPLLSGPDPGARIAALLTEREPLYAAFPQVETFGRTPEQIATDIVERFHGLNRSLRPADPGC